MWCTWPRALRATLSARGDSTSPPPAQSAAGGPARRACAKPAAQPVLVRKQPDDSTRRQPAPAGRSGSGRSGGPAREGFGCRPGTRDQRAPRSVRRGASHCGGAQRPGWAGIQCADLRGAPQSSRPATGLTPAAHRRTNSLAVAALVCSVIPGLPQLAAIILGIGALRQTRRTGERGTALATAGLAIASLGLRTPNRMILSVV